VTFPCSSRKFQPLIRVLDAAASRIRCLWGFVQRLQLGGGATIRDS